MLPLEGGSQKVKILIQVCLPLFFFPWDLQKHGLRLGCQIIFFFFFYSGYAIYFGVRAFVSTFLFFIFRK